MILLAVACDKPVPERSAGLTTPPMNMEELKKALGSFVEWLRARKENGDRNE